MSERFVVANTKENGSAEDVISLLERLAGRKELFVGKRIVLCLPFLYLPKAHYYTQKLDLSIAIGSQDVSRFPGGSFTGEVSAKMAKEYASYTLLGHSERRANFGETDAIVVEKAKRAAEVDLDVIYCISTIEQVRFLKQHMPEFKGIFLLEDPKNISTGKPDDLGNKNAPLDVSTANALRLEIKKIFPANEVIYGGSVDKDNVKFFDDFDGVIVGARSLNPSFFLDVLQAIIQHA